MSILHKLTWRYAVRSFDQNKKVSEEDITYLLNSVRLSPSALGLQPYDILIVHDKKLQKELITSSMEQQQVFEASHLIIFAVHKNISDDYIQEYLEQTAKARSVSLEDLEELKLLINQVIENKKNKEGIKNWSTKQAYLAMGILLLAAADKQIDVCPLELINTDAYNKILGLNNDLDVALVAAVGYRSQKDQLANKKKSRRNLDDMTHLYYN